MRSSGGSTPRCSLSFGRDAVDCARIDVRVRTGIGPDDDGRASMAAGTTGGRTESEASIGQLVAGIQRDLSTLVRGEIELAKAELRESAEQAGVGGALFAAAAFLAVLASIVGSVALGYA